MDIAATRAEWTAKWGALTLDTATGPSSRSLATIANVSYRNLADLLRSAAQIIERDPGASYYAFHSGRGEDIVVSLADGRAVATWSKSGAAITALSPEDARTLAEDAALRDTAGTIEVAGIASAFEAIERALEAAPTRPELLNFAQQLMTIHKYSLVGRIIDARLAADPDDVAALILEAQITMNLVNSGQWGRERLANAEHLLTRALKREPTHVQARLLWCDVPRFAGDPAASAQRFHELLAQAPDTDVAHYYLGAIYLAGSEPARALEHFCAGERLAPRDADYAFGCARALLALNRREEARTAYARGAQLDPEHRLVRELESALG